MPKQKVHLQKKKKQNNLQSNSISKNKQNKAQLYS
jgi:hypothetical protein